MRLNDSDTSLTYGNTVVVFHCGGCSEQVDVGGEGLQINFLG